MSDCFFCAGAEMAEQSGTGKASTKIVCANDCANDRCGIALCEDEPRKE